MININKPRFDKRKFKGGILSNNIKYVCIQDKFLEKSFVTVSVNIGSYSNPKGYDGLAHFLEHMLFMGSKKYPNENHYYSRLAELGGSSNAYTDVMETVYYFNVFDSGLSEILDIFSRFFIDPLFDPDAVSREINAVDSEHKKNINSDIWKRMHFRMTLADDNSPVNTFMTGSLNTLNKKDIREKMMDFYKKYYKADNISICIASSKNIDEIYNMLSTTFGNIEKDSSSIFKIEKPFYTKNIGKSFYLKTTSNIYNLCFLWELPNQNLFFDTKDFIIFDLVLNNQSENSLYFYLKNSGLINSINTEINYEGIYNISITLTREGLDNITYIESLLFKCIDNIKNENIKKYAQYYQKVSQITFDTITKLDTEDLVNNIAVNHHYYPTENVYDGNSIIRKIKETSDYQNIFNKYIKSDNCIKILSSPISPYDIKENEFEKLFEYDAYFADITKFNKKLQNIKNVNFCCLDIKNQYLDVSPTLENNLDKFEVPTLIGERQWYGGCSQFGEPIIYIWLQFNNIKYFSSPKNYILTSISTSIIDFLASTILYKSYELNYKLHFQVKPSSSSIIINIKAFSDKKLLYNYIDEISNFMLNIKNHINKISDIYIKNLFTSFKEIYKNVDFLNSWEYSSFVVKDTIYDTEYSIKDLLKELENISIDEVKNHIINLFDNSALTSLVYGNIKASDFPDLFIKFNKYFYNSSYLLPKINPINSIELKHPNKNEKSNCITYYYPVGSFIPKEFILLALTTKILAQPFFDDLRTKNAMGYLVRLGYNMFRDNYYIIQKIQSDKSVKLIEEKIDNFNKNIINLIKNIDFKNYLETVRKEIDEPDTTIYSKYDRYLSEISIRQYLFNRHQLILEQIDKVSQAELIKYVEKYINPKNRIRILINGNE
jgi:insulysin